MLTFHCLKEFHSFFSHKEALQFSVQSRTFADIEECISHFVSEEYIPLTEVLSILLATEHAVEFIAEELRGKPIPSLCVFKRDIVEQMVQVGNKMTTT